MLTFNLTGEDVEAGELSLIEAGLGIIAACLPACRTLFARIFNTPFGMRYFYSRPRSLNSVELGEVQTHEYTNDKSKVMSASSKQTSA